MAQSKDKNREVGEYESSIDVDLVVVRCTREWKGDKTDEVLGTFTWDEWEDAYHCYDTEVARIVRSLLPEVRWVDHDGLSTHYSKAMNIMMNDKKKPFVYAMMFKGDWLDRGG